MKRNSAFGKSTSSSTMRRGKFVFFSFRMVRWRTGTTDHDQLRLVYWYCRRSCFTHSKGRDHQHRLDGEGRDAGPGDEQHERRHAPGSSRLRACWSNCGDQGEAGSPCVRSVVLSDQSADFPYRIFVMKAQTRRRRSRRSLPGISLTASFRYKEGDRDLLSGSTALVNNAASSSNTN